MVKLWHVGIWEKYNQFLLLVYISSIQSGNIGTFYHRGLSTKTWYSSKILINFVWFFWAKMWWFFAIFQYPYIIYYIYYFLLFNICIICIMSLCFMSWSGGGHLKKENKYKKSRIFSQYCKSIVETNKDLTFPFNYFSLYAYHCNWVNSSGSNILW